MVSDNFVMQALMRRHGITQDQASKLVSDSKPDIEIDRFKLAGFSCPFCGTWKPVSSIKKALTNLEKRKPDLAAQNLAFLKENGFPA